MSRPHGTKVTEKTRKKISKTHTGMKRTKEHRENTRKAALKREARKRWQKRWGGLGFLRRLK